MLNEREEFLSYITFPEYTSKGKNDTSYLGKFAMDTLLKFHGILRVLTIIARNYMFEDKKDILKPRVLGLTVLMMQLQLL